MLKRYDAMLPGNNASLTWQSELGRNFRLGLCGHPNGEATFDLHRDEDRKSVCSNITKEAAAELIEWLQEFVDG
jgi:hypothetical protein